MKPPVMVMVVFCYTSLMETLSFEPAGQDDAELVSQILTDATRYKNQLGDTMWGDEGWSVDEVLESMSESTMYIIKQGDEVVATASLQWEDERNWGEQPPVAGYMHRLAVRNDFHGQGLGETITDWISAQVAKEGRQYLRLDCEESNTELCAYYEKLGFVKVGTRPVPEYGDYAAALYQRPVATSASA